MPTEVPMGFDDFVGNEVAVSRLKLLVADANQANKLPHIGFFGPAGHGKTTLSQIVAKETDRNFVYINSVAIKKPTTLRGILTNRDNCNKGAVVCLDECHRLPKAIQDSLLSVLEEPSVLVTSYKDTIIKDELPDHMTFILATTHQGLLNDPLLSRLECIELHEYSVDQLFQIAIKYLVRVGGLTKEQLDASSIEEIGRRARSGRDVVRICENIRRFMRVYKRDKISLPVVEKVFGLIGIDSNGLTQRDKKLLGYLARTGSCGLETLEAFLNLPRRDIKDKIEPWLLRRRLIIRSASGRTITQQGMAALRGEKLNVRA